MNYVRLGKLPRYKAGCFTSMWCRIMGPDGLQLVYRNSSVEVWGRRDALERNLEGMVEVLSHLQSHEQ